MEIQTFRNKGYDHLGFIDPVVVNCINLFEKPKDTINNLYKFLTIQRNKLNILFPYNFKWVFFAVKPFTFCIIEFFNTDKK